MFRALSEEGISIQMISTADIKTSVVIDEKYVELAVQPAQGRRAAPARRLIRQNRLRNEA